MNKDTLPGLRWGKIQYWRNGSWLVLNVQMLPNPQWYFKSTQYFWSLSWQRQNNKKFNCFWNEEAMKTDLMAQIKSYYKPTLIKTEVVTKIGKMMNEWKLRLKNIKEVWAKRRKYWNQWKNMDYFSKLYRVKWKANSKKINKCLPQNTV